MPDTYPCQRGRPGSRHLQRPGPAAQGGVVGHGQVEPEQAEDRADQALGLAQGQAEHGPQRQRGQDRQGRVPGLPAPGRARLRPPGRDRLVREPDRQAPALRRAASYSAQLVTRCRCLGMRWRRAALALNGTAGIRGSWEGPLPYATRPLDATRTDPCTKVAHSSTTWNSARMMASTSSMPGGR